MEMVRRKQVIDPYISPDSAKRRHNLLGLREVVENNLSVS